MKIRLTTQKKNNTTTMSLTTYPKTASEYARKLNRMDSGGQGPNFMGNLVTDQAHWDDYGVHSGEDLARYLAWNEYINLYKSIYGIKPALGIDYKKLAIEDIKAETEELSAMSRPEHQDESLVNLKKIIKEETANMLKEARPALKDVVVDYPTVGGRGVIRREDEPAEYKSVEETHIEEVLKKLHRTSENGQQVPPDFIEDAPEFAYTLGYQKALKDVAEELLGIIF